jgi:large subunit ribosomal protein L25
MAGSQATELTATSRVPEGSRATRRLRREGRVPGIVYGGGEAPVPFAVDSRELRLALAHAGAVIELQLDGSTGTPVVLKELIRHAVSGATMHIDLLRVRLDVAIEADVTIELIGGDNAPGVKEGGVLEQPTREVTVEALPTEIPDSIQHDISGMGIGDSLTLAEITSPPGVRIVDDPETLIATISAPRLQIEEEPGIEEETAVVGEAADAAAEPEAAPGGDASE